MGEKRHKSSINESTVLTENYGKHIFLTENTVTENKACSSTG